MNKTASRDGTLIAYDISGSGPPLILFDGAFCSRKFGPMPKLSPLLTGDFTVYAYDRRGRGDSGDTKPYAIERELEDLDAMIQVAGGSAFVFSISSGAMLALLAAASGLNIGKLAVYEPPYSIGTPKHKPPADHTAQLTRLIEEDRRGEAVKFYMTRLIGIPAIVPGIMQFLPMWKGMKANAPSLPYDSAVVGDFSLPGAMLKRIRIPTLVMGGEKSPEMLRKAVRAVAETVPDAKLQVLPKQTHNVAAKVLAPALADFFKA
ncbi:MAG: alpha/beta hydrolase [Fibrobacteres bacterium]|nr:alpha/beta hydrolase [Fibrobacterota bacterium]